MKKDLLTGETFKPSRINQKFARPENRITYYNNKANKLRLKKAFVNKPLHKNLRILEELLLNKTEVKIHMEFLRGKGFHFGVHTHFEEHAGKDRYAVYNFIIIQLQNDQIHIIKYD